MADPPTPRNKRQKALATPIKQAYAGPTFHASPAPSSLPMPRFFSKSVPTATPQSTFKDRVEADHPEKSVPPSPSPQPSYPKPPIQREESPLDILFNAQRAEQARKATSSSPQALSVRSQNTSFQPPRANVEPHGIRLSSPSAQHRQLRSGRHTGKEMFTLEMDGADDEQGGLSVQQPVPFQERLNAVRAMPESSQGSPRAVLDEEQRIAKSIALKQLLKGPIAVSDDEPTEPQNTGPPIPPFGYAQQPQPGGQPQRPDSVNQMQTRAQTRRPPQPPSFHNQMMYPQHTQPRQQVQPPGMANHSTQPLTTGNNKRTQQGRTAGNNDSQANLPTNALASNFPPGKMPVPSNPVQPAPDVKTMEADLRRLLRLDPPG